MLLISLFCKKMDIIFLLKTMPFHCVVLHSIANLPVYKVLASNILGQWNIRLSSTMIHDHILARSWISQPGFQNCFLYSIQYHLAFNNCWVSLLMFTDVICFLTHLQRVSVCSFPSGIDNLRIAFGFSYFDFYCGRINHTKRQILMWGKLHCGWKY